MSVVGKSFCSMLSSCDRVGDVRARRSGRRSCRRWSLDRFNGRPRVLHTHCLVGVRLRAVQRGPVAGGRDGDERGARARRGSSSFGHRADTAATLALLRVEQGRLDEAAALLEPYEDRIAALRPDGALAPQPQGPGAAAAVLRRGLGELVGDALRGATLLSLLVEAELADGDVDAARAAADRRRLAIAADAEARCWLPSADRGRSRPRRRPGRGASSPTKRRKRQPRDRRTTAPRSGSCRLELAEVFAANGDSRTALAEARAALAASNGWVHAVPRPGRGPVALARRLGAGCATAAGRRLAGVVDRPASRGARPRSGRATATPRSPSGCSSRPRPPSTTSAAS